MPSSGCLGDRVVAADPGLVRLRMASTTVFTLGLSLSVLYALTQLAGQTFTVALLGVVVSMIASMAFNDRRPIQRVLGRDDAGHRGRHGHPRGAPRPP